MDKERQEKMNSGVKMEWKTLRVCDTMLEARKILAFAKKEDSRERLELKFRIVTRKDKKYEVQIYLPSNFDEMIENID